MMKAMILAAGRGERMRPLSDTIPKPLLRVGNEMLIERHMRRLAAINVKEIVVNVSYLAQQIQDAIGDGSAYGVHIEYSHEPQALEVGGGIFQALPLLGASPFILLSADIWTEYPLDTLPIVTDQLAHLVLVKNPPWHSEGDFGIEQGYVIPKTQSVERFTYANIGVISPALLKGYHAGKFPLGPVLQQAATQKCLTAEVYAGEWHNIGTIELYRAAEKAYSSKKDSSREVVR